MSQQKYKGIFIILLKYLLILFHGDYFFPIRKYLRQKHSHGCYKTLFTVRLLLFRLGERYSVVTARHEERYLLASTFPFITAFSTPSRSYETICNFVQRYSGSHVYIYDPRIYPGSRRRWGKRIERQKFILDLSLFLRFFSSEFTRSQNNKKEWQIHCFDALITIKKTSIEIKNYLTLYKINLDLFPY